VPEALAPVLFEASVLDADARTRDLARDVLGRSPHAVPVELVTALLAHPRPGVRRRAAETVARLGPAAVSALPALDRVIPDPSRKVRRAALDAVHSLGPLGSSRAPLVLRRVFEAEATVVAAARRALRAIEAPLPQTLRTLLGMVGMAYGPEGLLLDAIDDALPASLAAELGRVALARSRWLDGLGGFEAALPAGAPSSLRYALLSTLAAAERAAKRHGKGVPEGTANRRARDREAAWLLAFVVRGRMMGVSSGHARR
jgi:HEAT repeats